MFKTVENKEEPANLNIKNNEKTCLKCNDCGKKFHSLEQAELHAARTLHDDFVEAAYELDELEKEDLATVITEPVTLTDEQKTARLEELRAKLALKRAARAKELQQTESLRRASSKELEQIKRDLQAKEMKKLAEERRMDKIMDKKRREEIKKQIEEDRNNKKAQIAAEKAKLMKSNEDENEDVVVINNNEPEQLKTLSSSSRIQVKLPMPYPTLKLTFDSPCTQTLKDLKDKIKANCPDIKSIKELMGTFPTRSFGEKDDECSLSELGLIPSATLILK